MGGCFLRFRRVSSSASQNLAPKRWRTSFREFGGAPFRNVRRRGLASSSSASAILPVAQRAGYFVAVQLSSGSDQPDGTPRDRSDPRNRRRARALLEPELQQPILSCNTSQLVSFLSGWLEGALQTHCREHVYRPTRGERRNGRAHQGPVKQSQRWNVLVGLGRPLPLPTTQPSSPHHSPPRSRGDAVVPAPPNPTRVAAAWAARVPQQQVQPWTAAERSSTLSSTSRL